MVTTSKKLRLLSLSFIATTVAAFSAPGTTAGTLENLERERALLIETILDPALAPDERETRITTAKARLVDLERLVLRDRSLRGRNTPTIRRAFANYDLTFLVHTALEKNRSIADIWLEQVGLSTVGVMSATIRRR